MKANVICNQVKTLIAHAGFESMVEKANFVILFSFSISYEGFQQLFWLTLLV
jgi:hypothetical protein